MALVLGLALGAGGCLEGMMPGGPSRRARRHEAIDLLNQGDRARAAGEVSRARDLYRKSLDWWPLPATYFGLGNCYLDLGDFERAEYCFRQAAHARPNEPLYLSQADYAEELARSRRKPESAEEPEDEARAEEERERRSTKKGRGRAEEGGGGRATQKGAGARDDGARDEGARDDGARERGVTATPTPAPWGG